MHTFLKSGACAQTHMEAQAPPALFVTIAQKNIHVFHADSAISPYLCTLTLGLSALCRSQASRNIVRLAEKRLPMI